VLHTCFARYEAFSFDEIVKNIKLGEPKNHDMEPIYQGAPYCFICMFLASVITLVYTRNLNWSPYRWKIKNLLAHVLIIFHPYSMTMKQ
jgi:hypothetical protein